MQTQYIEFNPKFPQTEASKNHAGDGKERIPAGDSAGSSWVSGGANSSNIESRE
eukprot:m.267429 g.267429  ORF g.267429 m.267429 type:complete len:54 (-) comp33212_c0_seq1:640-801(-)